MKTKLGPVSRSPIPASHDPSTELYTGRSLGGGSPPPAPQKKRGGHPFSTAYAFMLFGRPKLPQSEDGPCFIDFHGREKPERGLDL